MIFMRQKDVVTSSIKLMLWWFAMIMRDKIRSGVDTCG